MLYECGSFTIIIYQHEEKKDDEKEFMSEYLSSIKISNDSRWISSRQKLITVEIYDSTDRKTNQRAIQLSAQDYTSL